MALAIALDSRNRSYSGAGIHVDTHLKVLDHQISRPDAVAPKPCIGI
jgi:hypothetical protein